MKKILAIVLVFVMVMATGCGAADLFKFEKGTIDGDVYTNKAADVSFTLPKGWTFSTQEELDAMMEASGEVVGEDIANAANITTVYDCMANSADSTANILFMYENTALSGNADISEKDYLDAVGEGLVSSSSTTGLNYQIGETSEMEINGKTYYCGVATVDLGEGVTMEQRYIARKLDSYMFCACVTTFPGLSDTDFDTILANIK